MPSLEAENLIAHLSRQLAPADREAFRRAAESALDTPQCWGLGLIHRTVVGVWRGYFHPPTDGHIAAWEREQREINKRRLGGVSACVSTAASHATSHITKTDTAPTIGAASTAPPSSRMPTSPRSKSQIPTARRATPPPRTSPACAVTARRPGASSSGARPTRCAWLSSATCAATRSRAWKPRHQISTAQFAAGRHYQSLHEAFTRALHSLDLAAPVIDKNRYGVEPFSDRQAHRPRASAPLKRFLARADQLIACVATPDADFLSVP